MSDTARRQSKYNFALLRGGWHWGLRGQLSQNTFLLGKRHDNKTLKVQKVLSRRFVFIAQAPTLLESLCGSSPAKLGQYLPDCRKKLKSICNKKERESGSALICLATRLPVGRGCFLSDRLKASKRPTAALVAKRIGTDATVKPHGT